METRMTQTTPWVALRAEKQKRGERTMNSLRIREISIESGLSVGCGDQSGFPWVISHVPIFHITQPLGIWSSMATIRWCPIAPKWDIYQSLVSESTVTDSHLSTVRVRICPYGITSGLDQCVEPRHMDSLALKELLFASAWMKMTCRMFMHVYGILSVSPEKL